MNIAYDYGIKELPDIFVHTDYDQTQVTFKEGEIFNGDKTKVEIENLCELSIKKEIHYKVDKKYATFPNHAPKKATVYFFCAKLTSNKLGVISKPVIYFLFENINFLEEVLLRNNIEISHIVKVREGCGKGGNLQSITVAYAFLSLLKTKYLIIDNEVHFDWNLASRIIRKHSLKCNPFKLNKLKPTREDVQDPLKWSDSEVNIFEVEVDTTKEINRENINEVLKPLEKRWKEITSK